MSFYSTWKNTDSRLLQKLPPGTVTSCLELLYNAVLLHGNVRPRAARNVRQQEHWEWEVLEHSPYLPDLSPCDFDLISEVKEPLHGRWFHT